MSIDLEEVKKIRWYHSIDLGNGIITPGQPETKDRPWIKLPSLEGKTVLDIGAWDGYFSFEAEKLGAKRVLATDSFCWGGGGWGTKDGFLFARNALKSKVEDKTIDVLDLSPEAVGIFDITLFLGVLYHMKHPILALEKVASVTKELLVLETYIDTINPEVPAARFFPDKELNNDQTNWWGLNALAVEGLLKTVGFNLVEITGVQVNRMCFYAWK